jgi:hypothetical protein
LIVISMRQEKPQVFEPLKVNVNHNGLPSP